MALYYDATSVLSRVTGTGSLKSCIYDSSSKFRSKPAQIYALISEVAKYDVFLKEVIENSDLLAMEPKVGSLPEPFKHVAAD